MKQFFIRLSRRLALFWSRAGYAVTLCACAAVIGITAYATRTAEPEEAPPPSVAPYATATPTPRPAAAVTVLPVATPVPMLIPGDGKQGMGYAMEHLSYNQTLGEWRTHDGIDFLGREGDPVRAAANGTVSRIWEDEVMGNCIQITHADGYATRYCALASQGLVSVGDAVSAGQAIGTMGNTALVELEEGIHVHFMLLSHGEVVDPTQHMTSPDK